MPKYVFICPPCEEHKECYVDEVFMSISTFSDGGHEQICKHCGKLMVHKLEMPAVHYKGKGFHTTDYPKPLPQSELPDYEKQLEEHYIDKAKRSGAFDEAREATETVVIDQYKDTKTGKKVHKIVEE
jgi:predicted nucleic acid-binding Zn ribbon protein